MAKDGSPTQGKHRIVLVTDSAAFLRIIFDLVARHDDLLVVGVPHPDPANMRLGLQQIEKLAPRVILLDLDVFGGGGLATLAALQAWRPDVPVLVLSLESEGVYRYATQSAGARGLISKAALGTRLLPAIRQLLEVQ